MLNKNQLSTIKVLGVLLLLLLSATAAGCSNIGDITLVIMNGDNINLCSSGGNTVTDLSWSAPILDVNGYPLANSDITGYKLYYASSRGGDITGSYAMPVATMSVNVQDVAKYLNLAPNTYVLHVAAINATGNDIAFSNSQCVDIVTQ